MRLQRILPRELHVTITTCVRCSESELSCDKPEDLPVQIFFYNVHKRVVSYECEFACDFSENISVQKSSYKFRK